MKRSILITVTLAVTASVALASMRARTAITTRSQTEPRLVVLVVVDQMRADYLDRFAPLLKGGLARLVKSGVRFTEAHHDHAITETAPGHATLVTGVFPSRHGIVSNNWWDRVQHRAVYAVEDTTAAVVGVPSDSGRSPVTLLRETVADWLKEASPQSKVYSVAIKDRVAVLMGGRHPDGAFWFSYSTGRYVTSTYYTNDYPTWVTAFNDSGPVRAALGTTWDRLLPADAYTASRVDSFPAEYDGVHITFPHTVGVALKDSSSADPQAGDDYNRDAYGDFATTPFGDAATFEFARRLTIEEELGKDDVPDLLLVGASSADLIGHRYGPYSQEVEDYYLRLDQMLGDFLAFLDNQIGRDAYALVLTADHGVAMMPEEAKLRGLDAERVRTADFQRELIEGVQVGLFDYEIMGQPSLQILAPLGLVVTLSEDATEKQLRGLRADIKEHVQTAPVIADAFTYDEIASDTTPDRRFLEQIRHSFHPDRWSDVYLLFRENYVYPASLPAHHGTPYPYDTHVPLIVVVPGQTPATVTRRVRSVDVAPTIASILGVTPPADLDGAELVEVVRVKTGTGSPR
jgi:predicted AlkP superfamily pyrophosphatase or phosphodiesterase